MLFPEYDNWEGMSAANAILYEYMAGSDLSVQNEYLRNSFEAQNEERKQGFNPFGVFLGGWPVDARAEGSRPYDLATTLPELPVEIWSVIIDLATFIPGAYNTHDYSSMAAFMFDSRGVCARQRFESTMKDKLAISLVCKRLNAICEPFLFKHLRITSGAQACAVLNALRNGTDIGNKTTRIDLALEGNHAWTKGYTIAMMSIFLCCPNLVSFSTLFCDPDPWAYSLPSLIESLAKHNDVRRVEVKAERDVLRNLADFLQDLEVLWLLPCHRRIPLDVNDCYHMPKLRALIVSENCDAEVRKIEAPKLRACVIQKNNISILPSIRPEEIEYLSALDAPRTISTLEMWPNLRTLSVKYEELATRNIDWPGGLRHPNLEYIVIEDLSHGFLYGVSSKRLQDNMKSIIDLDIFPYLRCIRIHQLFEKDALPESEAYIRWEWLRMCLKSGLRVEMLQGNVERTENQWHTLSCDEMSDIL